MTTLIAVLAVGFFLGMRHAADPDHVVAVTTIVTRTRKVTQAAAIGAVWGAGHTLTIVLVGAVIISFSVIIPPRLGLAMELSVAMMLVLLGLLNLFGMRTQVQSAMAAAATDGEAHTHVHAHGDYVHTHVHGHGPGRHSHSGDRTPVATLDRWFGGVAGYRWLRPLVIGVVHGLAGSAAVALLVLATIPSPRWAVAYLLIFGVGTIAGMMLITVAIASGLVWAGSRSEWFSRRMSFASGLISLAFGLFIAYQIGWVQGLFTANPHWTPR